MLGLGLSLTQVAVRGGNTRSVGPQILISNRSQDENTAIGTTIGTFTVVGGTGTYTFSKTADPSSAFTLTGAVLKNAIVFDYETATAYSVTINANNGAGSSINRTLSIDVNDIDEVPPVILTSSTQTVAENSTFSITLTADKAVTWTKTAGADAALFTLTGDLLFLPVQDYEAPTDADADRIYVVQVTATSTAGYATNKTINVTVTDVSDTLPAPGTPTIVWTSAVTVSPPIFSFTAPSDPDLVVGDTVRFQRATVSDFSSVDASYTNAVDSGEDLANALTFTSGVWANGTWYVRARTERTGATPSDWSNTETKTLAVVSGTTLDPAHLGTAITLSNGNLTATHGGTNDFDSISARSTTSYTFGAAEKRYFEVRFTSILASVAFCGARITTSSGDIEFLYTGDGTVTITNTTPDATIQTLALNDWTAVAVNIATGRVWIKNLTTGSGWNNAAIGSQDPAGSGGAGTGGFDIGAHVSLTGKVFYAAVYIPINSDSLDVKFSSFTATPPTGYSGY